MLVVGAGPTGLMLANWLQRLSVDHVLIDGKDGPTRQSRAIAVQQRSFELYAQLGMIDPVRDESVAARYVRPGWQRRAAPVPLPVGRIGLGMSAYPGIHILEQSANERLLVSHLRDAGGTVSWGHELASLDRDDHGVTAHVTHDGGTREIRARWCVGADGASSPVRKAADIPFSGTTSPDTFWVADATGVEGLPAETVSVRLGTGSFMITFPLHGERRHRLVGVIRGEPDEAAARRIAEEGFGVTWRESGWFSTYRLHSRVADRFRDGRIVLAGDAAHVHSPVGGQGMNTGLQDAHNLAFKLAAVLDGTATDALLDRYDAERRPVARRLVSTSDAAFRFVTDQRPRNRRLRRLAVPLIAPVMPLLLRLPVGRSAVAAVGQLRIHYWMSDAAKGRARGRRDRVVGRRLPWTGSNHGVLREATWQVHAYSPAPPSLDGMPELVSAAHRFDPRPDVGLLRDRWYLVRPDGFVAAAAPPDGAPAEFARVLREHGYGDRAVRARAAAVAEAPPRGRPSGQRPDD
ncbi:2-polyprenyl-6-methoxyphenol hydroxylase [Pseudoclavibacter endophyticus]|nr:2-polyprenyl-6-methoxyphenol hydroxylase [Pseudoclavibacter endophyticus]